MGEACSTYVSSEKYIQNCNRETERNDLDVSKRMILKWGLKSDYELDLPNLDSNQ
jgi:hypothetical protein